MTVVPCFSGHRCAVLTMPLGLRILEIARMLHLVICLSPIPTFGGLQVMTDLHSVIRKRMVYIPNVLYKQNYIECILLRNQSSNKYLRTSALGTEPRTGQTYFLPLGRVSQPREAAAE